MIFFSFFENFYFERNSFLKTQFDLKKLFIEILTKKKIVFDFFFFWKNSHYFFLTNFIFKKELENFILVFGFLKTLKKKKKLFFLEVNTSCRPNK